MAVIKTCSADQRETERMCPVDWYTVIVTGVPISGNRGMMFFW